MMCTPTHTAPLSPDDNCKSRPMRTMKGSTCKDRRHIGIDHTKSHKAAAARRLAAAQLKRSCQHHIGARSVHGFAKRVYLLQLTASEFYDRSFCDAPAPHVRVHRTRERRANRRRSTMGGTPSSRDARVNVLLRFRDSPTCT